MTVTVAQITDSHLLDEPGERLHGLDPDESLRRVLAAVDDFAPDLIIASGDLTENGSPGAYRRLSDLLAEATSPVACLPGNHDRPEEMAKSLNGNGISCPTAVNLDGWRICLLDSTVPGRPDGCLGHSRLTTLDWDLKAHPRVFKLVFVHHQPLPSGSPWIDRMGLTDGEQLLDRLQEDKRVRAVACGHIHHAFTRRVGRLDVLGTPATSFQAQPNRDSFELDTRNGPGFRWFRLASDGVMETGITRVPPLQSS